MAHGWLALRLFAPNLLLCLAWLVVARRRKASDAAVIARLEELVRSAEALGALVDETKPCRPRHDPVPEPESAPGIESRPRTVENPLRRR